MFQADATGTGDADSSSQPGPPAKPSAAVSLGERTSDAVIELCRLRRSEGYGVREDEGKQSLRPTLSDLAPPETGGFRAEARTHFEIGGAE